MSRGPVYLILEVLTNVVLRIVFDFRSEGARYVPGRGGVILACTHQSHLDPVMVRAPLSRAVGFVARKTLFANRLFAGMITRLGAVRLDRDAASPAGLREIVALLRSGCALVFFPEGTRSSDGAIGPLRPGVALLARRAGVPVVPVAVGGTFSCWPRHARFFRPGRVRVVFGSPVVYGPGRPRDEVLTDLRGRLVGLMERAREMG